MLRNKSASSRLVRVGVFGLVIVATAVIATTDSAEARRYYRHRHIAQHSSDDDDRGSYSPQFSSIIVDGNSGAVLTATSPDGVRHPASLTKIMTLYLLFERLDSGKIKLDDQMPVSAHAADQDPTKLDLHAGQTIKVEDAIKGLVTRSANDAAVVIAEYIGGSEDEFAKMMTRKARALGMSRTVYRNASGLPNDEQVTSARDQSTLGRAIQDRFPRYYRYFSTTTFSFRGRTINGHNHLLGSVEGVDGIKTGYTRASGFNLVTSIHRGNRFLVGVVLGGRSGGSRDAIMRNLLAENLNKAATTRTAAAITERNGSDAAVNVADADPDAGAPPRVQAQAAIQPATPANSDQMAPPAMRTSPASRMTAAIAEATAAVPPIRTAGQTRIEPAPMTSGVIQSQAMALVPGSSEPMKPVRVKTVQVKAGPIKLASAGAPGQAIAPITTAVPQAMASVPETSNAAGSRASESRADTSKAEFVPPAMRNELPPQPAGHGTGNGVLGVLSAAAAPAPAAQQLIANANLAPAAQPQAQTQAVQQQAVQQQALQQQALQQNSVIKPVAVHTGWIVQVGALESEDEAQKRIEAARSSARGLLAKADPFTEPVIAKDNRKLYRARFAGLERDQADAVCRTLRRSDIPCMTARN
jgi:D-alanyl-D-alanine carboxypeptidase